MKRLKRMPVSVRKDLENVADMILKGEGYGIMDCAVTEWYNTQEAKMFQETFWMMYPKEKIIAIAIMLTMPSEIINHECCPKKTN